MSSTPKNLRCSGAATAFCANGGCQIRILFGGDSYAHPVEVPGGEPTLVQGPGGGEVGV